MRYVRQLTKYQDATSVEFFIHLFEQSFPESETLKQLKLIRDLIDKDGTLSFSMKELTKEDEERKRILETTVESLYGIFEEEFPAYVPEQIFANFLEPED